jgi:microcystin-dependent protein
MSTYFLGEIRMFGGNYAIKHWAFCNGQLMSIAQNQALFSLIGTTYGGDGRTTFALPDLRGRLPMSQGQGPGLSNYVMGQSSGSENVTLTINEMPMHTHQFSATADNATTADIANNVLPGQPTTANSKLYAEPGNAGTPTPLAQSAVGLSGGNLPHSNLMPSLCVTFIIALQGMYPSRN